ncbi:MAG TPA: hypothetical protein VFT22_07495 [Kofleriaceae bacterium]|nr:hypothetical protein [Kofleriaceae bacterium]
MNTDETRYLARSTTNYRMIFCTDGEFHDEAECGPNGFCARLYKTARRAAAVRGGTVTVHRCDTFGVEA